MAAGPSATPAGAAIPSPGALVPRSVLVADVAQIDFETQEVGVASEPRQWTITNTGGNATGSLTLANPDAMTFQTTTDCGSPLPPGGSCSVSARFVGQNRMVTSASVTVTDGSNTAQTQLSVIAIPALTIRVNGLGRVQITSDAPVPCDSGCRVLSSGAVALLATPAGASSSRFTGWTSSNAEDPACTGGVRDCRTFIYVPETITANFAAVESNLMFVSSEEFPSDLGGSAPYDAACNRLATVAGINDASGAGYVAALSGPEPFFERIPASARGWVRVDGMPVADTLDGLLDNDPAPFYPVSLDEFGHTALTSPWTGTYDDNDIAPGNCASWTLASPTLTRLGTTAGVAWPTAVQGACDQQRPLFCMGVTKTAPVVPQSFAGKRLWVTATSLTIGAQTPDSFCQASRPAGVANAVALIGYTSRPAADAIDPAATYVRPDGALLGRGAEILAGQLTTAARVTNDGTVLSTIRNEGVWTGGLPSDAPTASTNCNDWNDPQLRGRIGEPMAASFSAFSNGASVACTEPLRLYCVEL